MQYLVTDFIKTGMTDSEGIKTCLQELKDVSAKTLLFTGKDFLIDEAITLPSHTTVIIDGCTIKQKDFTFDNVFRGDNMLIDEDNPYSYPLSIEPLTDIKIIGKNGAKIIGPDKNTFLWHPHFEEELEAVGDYWGWRSHQLNFALCSNMEISGLYFTRTRSWALCFGFCDNIYVHDIEFDTDVKNGDGINFRAGCHDCKVANITGNTSDDTVACTALNNLSSHHPRYLYPNEPAKKFYAKGDPRKMDIYNIEIENLNVSGRYHAVICLAAAGLRVYDISIKNIRELSEKPRLWHFVEIYTGYGDGYNSGDLHNITVEDVYANCGISQPDAEGNVRAFAAVACRADVKDITLKNIKQKGNGEKFFFTNPEGINIE